MPEPTTQTETQPAVDLANPAIQAAIEQAKAEGAAAARAQAETEMAGLKKNRDELIRDMQKLRILGKPEEIAEKVARLETLDAQIAAGKAGVLPEQYKADVEKAAQAKYETRRQELEEVRKKEEQER